MTLRDVMARHARGPLVRLDHFGETATYHFVDPGEGPASREVRVVVDRLDREPTAELVSEVAQLRALVAIPADATVGVTAVNTGGDQLELPMRLGAAAVRARIVRIVSQDSGMFFVEVER